MNIIAYDLYPNKNLEKLIPGFNYMSLEDVLKNSDIISLHCPAGEKPLINRESLTLMKEKSYLINTARASLIDQEALLEAMTSGHIAGYAVDAFETEPPQLTDLLRHKNVILTSHIGGFTSESVDRATEMAVQNILDEL
jgi:D-3-phosphoglycerate dehydrogenase